MQDVYSPHTGEHIKTDSPAEWMGRAGVPAPEHNPQTHGCFWRGDSWELVAAEPAKPPVPQSCTNRQGKLALIELGYYTAAIDLLAAIEDPIEKLKAEVEWNAPTFERDSQFLQGVWEQLGGTPEQLDDAFRLAVTL